MNLSIALERPWLRVDLPEGARVLSFAPAGAGDIAATRVCWREVRDADLGEKVVIDDWLAGQISKDEVVMITSRNVSSFIESTLVIDGVAARTVATVGLSNAERVGLRRGTRGIGTINILVAVDAGLTPSARLEALTIAAEARTTAVIDAALPLPGGLATGTGTDCIAVASFEGAAPYAGLHTAIGEAVGRSVYDAVRKGVSDWMAEFNQSFS